MSQIKYFYIRVDNNNSLQRRLEEHYTGGSLSAHRGDPIACVAYIIEDSITVRWALATCNTECDKFDKRQARHLSSSRLEEEYCIVTLKPTQTVRDIQYAITRRLVDDKDTPTRVKKAAKEWLYG